MPPFQTTGINLLRGWPNPSLLPAKQLLTASQKALSDPETFVPGLLYGPDPGFQPLRESISQWLRDFYQPTVRRMLLDREGGVDGGVESEEKEQAERICITGGASQNLANVLLVYSDPQVTTVWIVAPCYFMACNIFDDVGCVMRAVGEGEEGVDLEVLEKGLEEAEAEGRKKVSLMSLIQGEGTGLKGGEGTSRESLLGRERNGKG
jgi:DNA-binding transcriptional MocR family regulator